MIEPTRHRSSVVPARPSLAVRGCDRGFTWPEVIAKSPPSAGNCGWGYPSNGAVQYAAVSLREIGQERSGYVETSNRRTPSGRAGTH